MAPPGHLGVDVGSSATRVSLLDEHGVAVATTSAPCPTSPGPQGAMEQDPGDWIAALERALGALPAHGLDIASIGLCGQTPTLVLVDGEGEPVRPAMTWQDTRARAEAAELAERLGDPVPLVGTALPWSAANLPAKLLWLARHEPAALESTRSLLQPKDYVARVLTGETASDPWSSKGLCDVRDGSPAHEVLAGCGWDDEACPKVAPAWAPLGVVSPGAAARFGLPAGAVVSVGWSDALAQVLAAGCYERHSAFFFSGTSAIVGTTIGSLATNAEGLFHVPVSCSPEALLYGPTQSSGAAVAWVGDLLDLPPEAVAGLAERAVATPPTFVPYLAGERAPWWDPDLRALFLGVGFEHGRAELARAVLDGVFLSARHVLACTEAATGADVELVEVAGRGVGDPAWEHLALEALGVPLNFHRDPDLSARGAAMLGAMAAGAELTDVTVRLGDEVRRVEPSPPDRARSQERLERYVAAAGIGRRWSKEAVVRG